MPSRAASSAAKVGPSPLRGRSAPVGVDVLPQQRDLEHPVGHQRLHLGDELWERPAAFGAAHEGHDAVGAEVGAAGHDLHPGLKGPLAAAGEPPAQQGLVGEEAARLDAVAAQGLAQVIRLCGPRATSTNG